MRFLLAGLIVMPSLVWMACGQTSQPLGTRLQNTAGDRYEVIYTPWTGIYNVEPK